jgi:hypothetical protein
MSYYAMLDRAGLRAFAIAIAFAFAIVAGTD